MRKVVISLSVCVPLGLALAAAPLATAPARAQAVSSADVNIVSVTGSKTAKAFTCVAVINNQNDDDAYQTRVIVLLPVQVVDIRRMTVTGGIGHCTKGPLLGGFGRERHLRPRPPAAGTHSVQRTVTIVTTNSTAANYPQTCSAFILSAVGDIDKKNNYLAAAPVP